MGKIQELLGSARVGMITNQSAFGPGRDYHFRMISKACDLKKLFLPEHGLFGELQDQVSGADLCYDLDGIEIINLYGDEAASLLPSDSALGGLDLIVVDIRDVGSRYYTFLTTAFYFLKQISAWNHCGKPEIKVLLIDSPNPAGQKVEGSPLQPEFESFLGVNGVLHRHGLTPGELLKYYNITFSLGIDIEILPPEGWYRPEENEFLWVPPSPNVPFRSTCLVYSGQCLLEGANISEGRGTTRPFETFGAPYINENDDNLRKVLEEPQKDAMVLRPLRFIPTFHKYTGEICNGYQLMLIRPEKFHALFFTLKFLRTVRECYPRYFAWLDGKYDYRSEKPAIELLVGDRFLLEYLNGRHSDTTIREYLSENELAWKEKSYRTLN
ncbi:MAG TPA: DUF1343 domain-containing protein [Sphingobacteriaceae bacterium]